MTPPQVTLVQDSVSQVAPAAGRATPVFHSRLFALAPEVKPFFKAEMTDQGAKLMSTLGTAVNGLKDLDSGVAVARDPAARYIACGRRGRALRARRRPPDLTQSADLGDHFTAWRNAYVTQSGVMIEAAYPAAAAP